MPLLTIGHGTSDHAELAARLHAAGIRSLVDVRRFPGSRRNPDVARDALQEWMPDEGISYVWEERLGGRRRAPKDEQHVDAWWRVEAFRSYAAHTRTPEFGAALDDLVERIGDDAVAVMCSEFVWWRCHRRLISDAAMLLRDVPVVHVMPDGRKQEHEPSEGARVVDGLLTYPATEAR